MSIKKGYLIVNPYLVGAKYDEIYSFLSAAFGRRGAELKIRYTDEFCFKLGESPVLRGEANFVVFWDKDHYLANAIENAGIKVFNSAYAVKTCDSKAETYLALERAGVKIPETIFVPKTFENVGYTRFDFLDRAEKLLGYPMVIKEFFGSFGKQVYLAENKAAAKKIMSFVQGRPILLQKFVAESRGRDIRINVVGDKAVASIERRNETDFRSNLSSGGKAKKAEPTEKQINAAISALKAVKADWGGVDVLCCGDEPLVLEVNSNMHFLSTFKATGVDVSEYIAEYVLSKI